MAVKSGDGKRSRGGLVVVTIVLIAVVLGGAFYQQEIMNYWRLQGWDPGAVRQFMERFVREGHDGQASAGELLDPAWVKPSLAGGKLVGIIHSGAHGPVTVPLKVIVPDGTIKDCRARIKNRSGVFQADVQFPNGQWGQYDVDRVKGALRIRTVPDALSSTQPQPQPWD